MCAIDTVGLLGGILVPPRRRLHFSALAAELEPWSNGLPVGHLETVARFCWLAEIDVLERYARQEFEAECGAPGGQLPSFLHSGGFEVRQQLSRVEHRLAVLGAIVNTSFLVVAVGDRL